MATPIPIPAAPKIANGSCRRCFDPCVRYGVGGNPLCDKCLSAQMELWGPGVRLAGRGAAVPVGSSEQ